MPSFVFLSLASVPNVPVRCLSVFSSLLVLAMTEGKWSGIFHTSWKSTIPTKAESRRSGTAGPLCAAAAWQSGTQPWAAGLHAGKRPPLQPCMEQPGCCAWKSYLQWKSAAGKDL